MSVLPDNRGLEDKPVSGLVADALHQFSRLIRSEFSLARAELVDKSQVAARGAAMVAGGALLVIPSVALLLIALAALMMEYGMRASLAYLLAGVLGLLIGAAVAWSGMKHLKARALVPRRTLGQLQQDAATAREHM